MVSVQPYINALIPTLEKKASTTKETEQQVLTSNSSIDSDEPPQFGKRLIVQVVDSLAAKEPERLWATVTKGQNIEDGFQDFTTKQLANAVNNVAWWLHHNIGRSENFEVLAYLGLSDIRYAILFFAAVKCGYVVGPSNLCFRSCYV